MSGLCCTKLFIPLVDRKGIAHARITSTTDRNQIINVCFTTLALGDIMTTLVIKHIDLVRTPHYFTSRLKLGTDV